MPPMEILDVNRKSNEGEHEKAEHEESDHKSNEEEFEKSAHVLRGSGEFRKLWWDFHYESILFV